VSLSWCFLSYSSVEIQSPSLSSSHHRRYRITEGSEEIQMRRVGQILFGIEGFSSRNVKGEVAGIYKHDPMRFKL
jgi:hypothetical protein